MRRQRQRLRAPSPAPAPAPAPACSVKDRFGPAPSLPLYCAFFLSTTVACAWLSVAASVQVRRRRRAQQGRAACAASTCRAHLLPAPAPSPARPDGSDPSAPPAPLQLLIALKLSFGPHLDVAAVLAAAAFTCVGAWALLREHDTGAREEPQGSA